MMEVEVSVSCLLAVRMCGSWGLEAWNAGHRAAVVSGSGRWVSCGAEEQGQGPRGMPSGARWTTSAAGEDAARRAARGGALHERLILIML